MPIIALGSHRLSACEVPGMNWIAHKTFDRMALGGPMTIKRGERLEEIRGVLFQHGRPVCLAASQAAKEHFAPDGDGQAEPSRFHIPPVTTYALQSLRFFWA